MWIASAGNPAKRAETPAANARWLLTDRVVRLTFGLVVGVWVARYLEPARFGELGFAIAFAALFQTIATLGLDGIIVRDLARGTRDPGELLGSVLFLRVAVGVVGWVAAIGATAIVRPGDIAVLLLVAIVTGSAVLQSSDVIDLWFQSQSQNWRTVAAKLTAHIAANGVKVALILGQAPLIAFACVVVGEACFAAGCLVVAYKSRPAGTKWRVMNSSALIHLVNEGWPYWISSVAIYCYLRLDLVLVGLYLDKASVGIYSAAATIANLWHFIPAAIGIAVGPFMARLWHESPEKHDEQLLKLFRQGGLFALGLSVALAMFAKQVVALLYGPQYAQAAALLAIKGFCNIPVWLGVLQTIWIVNAGKGGIMLVRTLFGAASAICLNLIWLPAYGLVGAAWASLCSFFITDVLTIGYFSRKIFLMQFGLKARNR